MHGVDTNVIVRYLIGDGPAQAAQARAVIGQKPTFLPRTVLLKAEWVLRGVYDLPPQQVITALRALAGLPGVLVEDAEMVARAMELGRGRHGFCRRLHLAAVTGCEGFLTFDKRFARSGERLSGIPITAP